MREIEEKRSVFIERVEGSEERMEEEGSKKWIWLLFSLSFVLLVVLKVMGFLWWRPKRIEEHFSKQGIKGPPYRFFIGNVKELVSLMLKASSTPMPLSHNILPRVFSFYHHWKKIYGMCIIFFYISSSPPFFFFFFLKLS